jgi:hypothetical protein
MEIKRTRINYRLLGKLRSVKHNGVIDKTMYAKKLGLIKNNANVIVIDVKDTEEEANAKIQKTIDDFKYDRENECDKEIIQNTFNIVKDDVKNQFLVVCDRQEFLLRTSTKIIKEQHFNEQSQYIDDHYVPLRINFDHLSKVEEEKNRRTRGDGYILNQKIEKRFEPKEKMTFKKIVSGIFDSVFSTSLDGI